MSTPDPYGQGQAYDPAQADQAVAQVQAGPAGDAGESLAHIAQAQRPALLPAEEVMNALMARFAEQDKVLAGMRDQLNAAQAQANAARAIAGPPDLVTYAKGIAPKLQGHADANPDLPLGHFAPVIETAAKVADEAAKVAEGGGNPGVLHGLLDAVERFVTRGHARKVNKPLDFSAVVSELDTIRDELDKMGQDNQAAKAA